MATFTQITDTSKKAILERVLCIQYPVQFHQKNDKDKHKDVKTLIDSATKINAIHPVYNLKLGFCITKIDINIQKNDKSYSDTFEVVIAGYSVKNKLRRVWFF